jgi:hypothetical protein
MLDKRQSALARMDFAKRIGMDSSFGDDELGTKTWLMG